MQYCILRYQMVGVYVKVPSVMPSLLTHHKESANMFMNPTESKEIGRNSLIRCPVLLLELGEKNLSHVHMA